MRFTLTRYPGIQDVNYSYSATVDFPGGEIVPASEYDQLQTELDAEKKTRITYEEVLDYIREILGLENTHIYLMAEQVQDALKESVLYGADQKDREIYSIKCTWCLRNSPREGIVHIVAPTVLNCALHTDVWPIDGPAVRILCRAHAKNSLASGVNYERENRSSGT